MDELNVMEEDEEQQPTISQTITTAKENEIIVKCHDYHHTSYDNPFGFYIPDFHDIPMIIILGIIKIFSDHCLNLGNKLIQSAQHLQQFYAYDVTSKTETLIECRPILFEGFKKVTLLGYQGRSAILTLEKTRLILNVKIGQKDVTCENYNEMITDFPSLEITLRKIRSDIIKKSKKKMAELKKSITDGTAGQYEQGEYELIMRDFGGHYPIGKTYDLNLPLLKLYLHSPYVRVISNRVFKPFSYDGFYYDPTPEKIKELCVKSDEHNTFHGFIYSHIPILKLFQAYKKHFSDFKFLQTMLFRTLCAKSKKKLAYFNTFICEIFRNPTDKPAHCPLFFGPQGSGKSWFFEHFLKDIIGLDLFTIGSNLEHFFGNFNSLIKDKLLILIEESTFNSDYQSHIKHAITSNTMIIRKMRTDAKIEQNFTRYVFCTQNVSINKVNIDIRERRIVYIRTEKDMSDDMSENFSRLLDQKTGLCMDKEFLMALYYAYAHDDRFYEDAKHRSKYSVGEAPLWAYEDLTLKDMAATTVSIFIKEILSGGVSFSQCFMSSSRHQFDHAKEHAITIFTDENSQEFKQLVQNMTSWPHVISQDGVYKTYCDFVGKRHFSAKCKSAENFWEEVTHIWPETKLNIILDGDFTVIHDDFGNTSYKNQVVVNNLETTIPNIHRNNSISLVELPAYLDCCRGFLESMRMEYSSHNVTQQFIRYRYSLNQVQNSFYCDFLPIQ
jgi:hypothetical protein